jgi:hypothetical protein
VTGPPERSLTDMHAVRVAHTNVGFHAVCACGRWDAYWSGPKGQAFALDDHDHHRRAESNGVNTPPVQ